MEAGQAHDDAFERLWKAVEERWESDAMHHAFVDFCSERNLLAGAAARYRTMAARRDVSRHMAVIQARALTLLSQRNAEERPRTLTARRRFEAGVFGVTVVAAGFLLASPVVQSNATMRMLVLLLGGTAVLGLVRPLVRR